MICANILRSTLVWVLFVVHLSLGARRELQLDECEPFQWTHLLPNGTRPSHYELLIKPDLNKATFEGQVSIQLQASHQDHCLENGDTYDCNSRRIILNAGANLKISQVELVSFIPEIRDGSMIDTICRDTTNELLVISLKEKLQNAQLDLKFSGLIDDKQVGIYYGTNVNSKSQPKRYVSAHFGRKSAHLAFPCFDEPSFKARFDLSIEHDFHQTVRSNMAKLKRTIAWLPHRVRTQFKRTPVMSVHLLTFVVGYFKDIEATTMDEKMIIRAHSSSGDRVPDLQFALDVAQGAYASATKWFRVAQPQQLTKIDLIPFDDHKHGATSQWGLISFDRWMLLQDQKTPPGMQMNMILNIVNQFVRLWFGNLITWHSERHSWFEGSFAEYLSVELAAELKPDHQFHLYNLVDSLVPSLEADAPSAEPDGLNRKESPSGDCTAEDGLRSKRMASIIRMVSHQFGPDKFRGAMEHFIDQFKYGTSSDKDLFSLMETKLGVPFGPLVDSWTSQAGHPVLKVSFANPELTKIRIEQQTSAQSEDGRRWIVPVTMLVADELNSRKEHIKFVLNDWIDYFETELPEGFDAKQQAHWFKLNAGFTGYYRVQYDEQVLKLMEEPIRSRQMSPADRINLLSDLRWAYEQQHITISHYAKYLGWFRGEKNGSVMMILADSIGRLRKQVELSYQTGLVGILTSYLEQTISSDYSSDVIHNQSTKLARIRASIALIHSGHPGTIEQFERMFERITDSQITGEVLEQLLVAVAHSGGEKHYERACGLINGLKSKMMAQMISREAFRYHSTAGRRSFCD